MKSQLWRKLASVFIFTGLCAFGVQGFADPATEQSLFDLSSLNIVKIKKLLVNPNPQGPTDFIDAMKAAKKSIHLEMFHITDWGVVNALTDAHKRGVEVKVLVDGKALKFGSSKKYFDQLVTNGVEARGSSPGFSLTHEKAMVVDGSISFVTTINLTRIFNKTRDYGVITEDASVADEIESVFSADWENAKNNSNTTPKLKVANLVWSPINSKDKLVGLIDSAKKSIVAQVENIGESNIQEAFARAVKRGVNVRLIVPLCTLGSEPTRNYPFGKQIAQMGVKVQMMPSPSDVDHPYIHAKMIIADETMIYIGSVNFSKNSTQYARELGIIFPDKTTATTIGNYFESDWKSSVSIPAQPPTDCPKF